MRTYTDSEWSRKVSRGTLAGRRNALRKEKKRRLRTAINAARKAEAARKTEWSALADWQIAADKAVDRIAAVKLAADLATRRTLVELERLNERAHELHVRRVERLKRSYITL